MEDKPKVYSTIPLNVKFSTCHINDCFIYCDNKQIANIGSNTVNAEDNINKIVRLLNSYEEEIVRLKVELSKN